MPFPLHRIRHRAAADHPRAEDLLAVLSSLKGTDYGLSSFYGLKCRTDLDPDVLGPCVSTLAEAGLVTFEERPDGAENLRTIGLTASGRRLLEEMVPRNSRQG